MSDDQDTSQLVTCAFFIGIIFKLKLEQKHGTGHYSPDDIQELEAGLDKLMGKLPPELSKIVTDKKIKYDMALLTDIYEWEEDVA